MGYYDYIAHYGVPGMKKGVRRWTNPDGTLNEAGKARYKSGNLTLYSQNNVRTTTIASKRDGTTTQYRDSDGNVVFETRQTGVVHKTDSDHASDIALHNKLVKNRVAAANIAKAKVSRLLAQTKTRSVETAKMGKSFVSSFIGSGKKKKLKYRIFPSKRSN